MMKQWLKENWLQLIAVAGIGIIIYFVFHKSPDVSEVSQYQINELNQKIKLKDHIIDSLTNSLSDADNEKVKHLDSLLTVSIEANNKTVYELKKKKDTIHADSLSSAELVKYFAGFR